MTAAPPRRTRRRHEPIAIQFGTTKITATGTERQSWRDPYRVAMTLSWPRFFLALLAVELLTNLAFAALYAAVPGSIANAAPGSLVDTFFFSLETLATVGYGVMAPATLYGHIVSAVEILVGLTFTALTTGLIFVRFSRPKSKIIFAAQAVVARRNGKPTLMIRLGNGGLVLLADATARLSALIFERTTEGVVFRRAQDLHLEQNRLPIFPLTWTLLHEINESSPLHGLTPARLAEDRVRVIVVIEARDAALGAQIHDIHSYDPSEIHFGMRYQDAITMTPEGHSHGDLSRLSLVEPDDHPSVAGTNIGMA